MIKTALLALFVALAAAAAGCVEPDNLSTDEAALGAHWHYANGSIDAAGALVIDFRIGGLGDAATTVSAAAKADAVWACRNHGGNWPADPHKTAVSATVEASGTFDPHNGRVIGSLTLAAPLTSPPLECPAGQVVTLVSVAYGPLDGDAEIFVFEAQAGPRAVDGGPFMAVFYTLPASVNQVRARALLTTITVDPDPDMIWCGGGDMYEWCCQNNCCVVCPRDGGDCFFNGWC
jgi:hypothetical protein